jgi:LPXTG-motif cell wall-anchored protein
MKRLVLVIGVVAALLFMAAPANADGYPPSDKAKPPVVKVDAPVVVAERAGPGPAPTARVTTGQLPRTGDDSSLPMARAAVVLLAGGGVLVLAARRRQADLSLA